MVRDMKLPAFYALLLISLIYTQPLIADDHALPRATPESQGVDTNQLLRFVAVADEQVRAIHSFMIVRHGKVVAEAWWSPEAADKPHVLWSLSKSFTSTAIGFAVSEGKLSLDDKVLSFFPKEAPTSPSEHLQAMTVRDLLTMSTGHAKEPAFRLAQGDANETQPGPSIKGFLAQEVVYQPGTHFLYNTPATYMCSAILHRVTGQSLVDYLYPRLFEPLGIERPRWDESQEGIALGGYGLFLKTEDIAKFGQLLLQKGKWQDKQLLPESWVEMATSKQVENGNSPNSDWNQGYGFQFWRCRHHAYRGDGKDGQFCVVLPEHDAVVVLTSDTGNMQAELQLVWDHLLPAFKAEPLGENSQAVAKMKEMTSKLEARK